MPKLFESDHLFTIENNTTYKLNLSINLLDPVGGIKYSVKRLRKSRSTRNKKYTNANGMVRYQECDSPCK